MVTGVASELPGDVRSVGQVISIAVLGPVVVTLDGTTVTRLRPGGRALVARLALGAGRVVPVDQLVDDLWDEEQLPANPGAALRIAASRARAVLGADSVVFDHGGYRIGDAELDVATFDALVTRGRAHLAAGGRARAADDLASALTLGGGAPGADVGFPPFPGAYATRLDIERLEAI